MAFHAGAALITAIALMIFIPLFHLSFRMSDISTWLVEAALPISSIPPPAKNGRISLEENHEVLYHIDGAPYFSPTHYPVASLPITSMTHLAAQGYWPMTIIRIPSANRTFDTEKIVSKIDEALEYDDVLTRPWLSNVLLVPELDQEQISPNERASIEWKVLVELHQTYGIGQILLHPSIAAPESRRFPGLNLLVDTLSPTTSTPGDLQGPYLASKNPEKDQLDLWPVYRLESDVYRTFLFGLYRPLLPIPSSESDATHLAFRRVDAQGYNYIPVPSRFYAQGSSKSLSGQRIGIKDIYDVKGVTTSGGSRAYGELYGPANSSALAVSRLLELGGTLVGKTKTATFAFGSRGNGDTVDEQYPFSARADGWQTCVGSSSGSGCAMGAYDWLDFAVGSDTGGSVRGPAARVGLYGNRPSTGTMPLDGVIPLYDQADTAGVLARDPRAFARFLKSWYAESPLELEDFPKTPQKLLVAKDYLVQANPGAQQIVDDFLNKVESRLGVSRVELDLNGRMSERNYTKESVTKSVEKYDLAAAWYSWTQVGRKFSQDYAAKHEFRFPPVDPSTRQAWKRGRYNGSEALYNESMVWANEFGDWFNNEVLEEDPDSCSGGIMVYDIGDGGVLRYREDELNRHLVNRNTSIRGQELCPVTECVDYTIPIGQVPCHSPITHVEEMTPVTISLIARRGCDFMLLDFVNKLADYDLIKTVKTGRTAF